MKNNNYTCHLPYLRNIIAYDHYFWYTYVKWWYLQVFFSLFFFFVYFLIFCSGVKGQKIVQNNKKKQLHSLRTILQEQYSIWPRLLVHLCKMMYHFFKILVLQVVSSVKGQKMTHSDKNCPLHSISQKPYIILQFMVHVCNTRKRDCI